MTAEKKAYFRFFDITRFFISLFFKFTVIGGEKVKEGAAIVCANHSSWLDPFCMALAFGKKSCLHFMGKVELFKKPVIGRFITKLGMFPVKRGENDVNAVRTTMKLLDSGEKVAIFPEGTRVSADDEVEAKTGSVRLAEKKNVPIYPVYIPRKKPAFSNLTVVVGDPYFVSRDKEQPPHEENERLSYELMEKIKSLKPQE